MENATFISKTELYIAFTIKGMCAGTVYNFSPARISSPHKVPPFLKLLLRVLWSCLAIGYVAPLPTMTSGGTALLACVCKLSENVQKDP